MWINIHPLVQLCWVAGAVIKHELTASPSGPAQDLKEGGRPLSPYLAEKVMTAHWHQLLGMRRSYEEAEE